jgi:hypothetical protein
MSSIKIFIDGQFLRSVRDIHVESSIDGLEMEGFTFDDETSETCPNENGELHLFTKSIECTFVHFWDVWGNETDGFDVNDVSRHDFTVSRLDSDSDVLEALEENGFNVSGCNIEMEWNESNVELTDFDTGKPLGRLEFAA